MCEDVAFGRLLRQYRVAAGWSQEALAERAGLSRRGIADLERGARRFPHPNTIKRLSEALQLDDNERRRLASRAAPADGPTSITNADESDSTTDPSLPTPRSRVFTSFVGRERDIQVVRELIAGSRLVTLIGAGGIGKTRLALRVIDDIAETGQRPTFVIELAPLSDEPSIDQTVLAAVGGHELPNRAIRDAIVARLQGLSAFLVLDNCEHLVNSCAEIVVELLQRCPGLRILATSRAVLGVPGETVWRVPPLSIPADGTISPANAEAYEAVQLFRERALAANPEFDFSSSAEIVARICRRLDGIPLAVELAAARVRHLGIRDIDARLDRTFDLLTGGGRVAPQRHQTLRATLDWSYNLLEPNEQVMLQRLSVFAGGATLAAVESVCGGTPIPENGVIEVLGRLIDRSLVLAEDRNGTTWFKLLETVRAYSRARVSNHAQEDLARRHCNWYMSIAEASEPGLVDPRQVDDLDQHYDNLRAALRWCIDTGKLELGLRLSVGLWLFWYMRGRYAEGGRWFSELLARSASQSPGRTHATALHWAAHLAANGGEPERALRLLRECVTACSAIKFQRGLALASLVTGNILRDLGNSAAAREQYQRALDHLDPDSEWMWRIVTLCSFAHALCDEGAYAYAERLASQALRIARERRHVWGMARALYDLGRVETARANLVAAHALLEESLAAQRELRYPQGIVWTSLAIARVHIAKGEGAQARARLVESLRLADQSVDLVGVAQCLEGLAELLASDDPRDSVRAAAAASGIRASLGATPATPSGERLEQALKIAREQLGESVWNELWTVARYQPIPDVIVCLSTG